MRSFRVEELNLEQVRAVYPEQLSGTFPVDELKPLKKIEQALARGEYVCYGAMDGPEALGVAFFVKIDRGQGPLMLFDYLAVKRELRCQGIGGRFLRALIEGVLQGTGTVLLETDEPACADSPRELEIRTRRLNFYLRNGLHDTGALATVYGVTYRILTLPVGEALTPDAARRAYAALYHSVFPDHIYRERVSIEGFEEDKA